VFLRFPTTADLRIGGRLSCGLLLCHNNPLSRKKHANALFFLHLREKLQLKLSWTPFFFYPPIQSKLVNTTIHHNFFSLNYFICYMPCNTYYMGYITLRTIWWTVTGLQLSVDHILISNALPLPSTARFPNSSLLLKFSLKEFVCISHLQNPCVTSGVTLVFSQQGADTSTTKPPPQFEAQLAITLHICRSTPPSLLLMWA
jgi:hypothetical protein